MTVEYKADVVVIGGGILGVTAAHHLKRAGAGAVVVVERDTVASGTSNAGAGFLGLWSGGYVPAWGVDELEAERYTLSYYADLATRAEIGYRNNGLVWVATSTEAYENKIKRIHSGGHDPDKRLLNPDEVAELTGIVAAPNVVGGVYFPSGAQVTASQATKAVAREIVEQGVHLLIRTPVTGVKVTGSRVTAVETTRGTIHTGAVVLAAGAWSNTLLRDLGVWAPQVPLVLSRITTEAQGIGARTPGVYLPEHDGLWMREELGGLLWGSELTSHIRHSFVDVDPPDRLDSIPIDPLFEILEAGRKVEDTVPVLAKKATLSFAQGLPTYTPDSRPLVGPVPGIDGLTFIGGCNESGVSHAPGFGRIAADLVMSGPDAGPLAFRLDRFGASITNNQAIVNAMAHNSGAYFR